VKYVIAAIGGYVVGWPATYVLLMGCDFRYFVTYFDYSWTGGGEIPTFIQLGGIAAALIAPLALLAWSLGRRAWSRLRSNR